MPIEIVNLSPQVMIIRLLKSSSREDTDYSLAPKAKFTVKPFESGKLISKFLGENVTFAHGETSAEVLGIGNRAIRANGLDQSPRSLKGYLASRSKTFPRRVAIRFTV